MADVGAGKLSDVSLHLLDNGLIGVALRDEPGEVRGRSGIRRHRFRWGTWRRLLPYELLHPHRPTLAAPASLADRGGLVEHRNTDAEHLRQISPRVRNGDARLALVAAHLLTGLGAAPFQGVVLIGHPLLSPASLGAQPGEQRSDPRVAHPTLP
ncbi:hypothetical protein ACWDHW_03275 [Streptomyces melanosporofaciens]